ncbi:MAG TPA: ribosomal protein S18-alanine N-acetyltransferase [Candidatus Methanofastidiosa archaeon]|nr:ribosomal protein S18-alanine N-acetyltransferase [Candidatus Methanofastidiosa archaeon]
MVREINAGDVMNVLKIEYECFKFPYPPNMINYLYANFQDTFLVAEVDKVAGYVIGIPYNDEGHVISLAVLEEYRNLGIGRGLMDRLMDILKREKFVTSIRLEVREGNSRAISFYKRMDFKICEKVEAYYEDGETALIMIKDMAD